MEFLAIVGLIAAVVHLWRRLDKVETRVAELEWRPPAHEAAIADDLPSPDEVVVTQPLQAPEPEPPAPEIPPMEPSWEPAEAAAEELWTDEPARARASYLPKLTFDFEDIFGRRLPIWAGGIALALAGIFLVRFSIEAGLLTPAVRVLLSFVFGLLLLAAAEAAYRFESRVRDPRVRQALAGAGLATLYAGFYLAGSRYGLIASGAAFLGLAAVTAAAIGLSFRFGLPSAVLGLVGGFAAPALVASEEGNVPILTLYLVLITAGLAFTGQRQQRPWLGFAALAGALVWGMLLLVSGLAGIAELVAFGLYITLLGAVVPLMAGGGEAWRPLRLAAALLASLQLAALLDIAGQQPLTWGLYLLLGAALAVLGWRDARMREASAFAAAVALFLLAMWLEPPPGEFWPVAAGVAAVFVAAPLALVLTGRGRMLDLAQLSLAAPALAAVAYRQFGVWDAPGAEPLLAAVTLGLALAPALAAHRAWKAGSAGPDLTLPTASAAGMAFAALLMLVPAWAAPLAAATVALVLCLLALRRPEAALVNLALTGGVVAVAALLGTPDALAEAERLGGIAGETNVPLAALRWMAASLPYLALARIEPRISARTACEASATLLAYGAVAQVMPADWLAWTVAVAAIATCARLAGRPGIWATLLAISVLWAWAPLMQWLTAGSLAVGGRPMLVEYLPGWRTTLLRLAPAAAALAFAAWRMRERRGTAQALVIVASVIGSVVLHVLYKQAFALDNLVDFISLGVAERTVWQGLLAGAGLLLLWRGGAGAARAGGFALLGLSLAHFGWFTLLLHNPLWHTQEVGPWPLANWLLPAYGIAALALVAIERRARPSLRGLALAAEAALMALIALYALSELRHLHAGTLPSAGSITQGENLMRSLLGIVLALLYLAWGSRTAKRSWRIGSLVLMLLAVGKVFLVDAAGLEGLLRIASFMALGFSLIGIGWVYSRQLRTRPVPEPAA
jgi:uncharacterized membrane protein